MTDTPKVPRAVVRRNRRWSSAWIVPTVALAIALWLVWQHYIGQGALVRVRFVTADGVQAEKTEVRCRSVHVGQVESVTLSRDLQHVIVSLRIERKFERLLRDGSRFWVVRPRVTASDVSGLGTLITGVYIELDPGEGKEGGVDTFVGLEAPPVTSSSVPGLRLNLVAETAGAINVGSPILFKGFEVGRVERRNFDVPERRIRYEVFITEEFASLVTAGVRFWNTSGIDIEAGADGLKIRTPSLQAILSGGVSFALPPDSPAGEPVHDGATFTLYKDEAASRQSNFNPTQRFLLLFDQSVRGLKKGAPVEFRGIPLGRVADIAMKYAPQGDPRIPVLIDIDPSLMPRGAPASNGTPDAFLADEVKNGLRARLGTASFLTGALFVDIDFVKGAPPAEITRMDDLRVLPTAPAGLTQLEQKVNAILTKIEDLRLEDLIAKYGQTATELNETLQQAKLALADAHQLLSKDQTQQLSAQIDDTLRQIRSSVASLGPNGSVQGDVRRTLDELRAALRAFKTLSDTVADKPNSLIFGKDSTGNPTPHAHRD